MQVVERNETAAKETDDELLTELYVDMLAVCDGDEDAVLVLAHLENHFSGETKIPVPSAKQWWGRDERRREWWEPLAKVVTASQCSLEHAKTAVSQAITDMDGWKPENLHSPKSICSKAVAIAAGMARQGAGGGLHASPSRDEAGTVWQQLLACLNRSDVFKKLLADYPLTLEAIRRAGLSQDALRMMGERDKPFVMKRFVEAYNAIS